MEANTFLINNYKGDSAKIFPIRMFALQIFRNIQKTHKEQKWVTLIPIR